MEKVILSWKNKKDHYRAALQQISDRKMGKITSLRCKSPKLNDATTDGFEFHTAVCFASRPGNGKSLLKEQLIKEFFEMNPTVNFRVMDWDLEMLPMITALREFSSVIEKSYKYLLSADTDSFNQKMSKEEFERLKDHVVRKNNFRNTNQSYPIDIVEDAPTTQQFKDTIEAYMEEHATMTGEVKVYTNTVVTLDHARLVRKEGRAETDMLYDLSAVIIYLKKRYPILFIILNHLNRSVTEASRCENGKISNYVVDADILGADALNQAVEVLVAIDCPYKRRIEYYGPERYITNNPKLFVFNFLKVRNGDTRISFYEGEFDKMRFSEAETPPTGRDMSKMRK